MSSRIPMVFSYGVFLLGAACVGCGGSSTVGTVSGTVTLDGQPVSDATLIFSPKKAGSTSAGRTDSSGKYTLQYTRNEAGAEIGEHSVRITTYQQENPDSEPPRPLIPEKIPVKYNYKTELNAEVKAGSNTIDFPLKADGPVMQPNMLEKADRGR